jgi:hypothetical protein
VTDGINAEALTALYGEWPSFHDAEVLRFSFERTSQLHSEPSVLELVIADIYGPAKTPYVVALRFSGVRDVKLDGFDQQNVLLEIEITPLDDGGLKTVCFGSTDFGGEWTSDGIEVVSVDPLV